MAQKLINETILALGSNLGNRKLNLEKSIELIQQKIGEVTFVSGYLKNPPIQFESDQEFINTCIKVSTRLSALAILNEIQEIERTMGRTRTKNAYENRIIDIDIILLNDEVIKNKNLTIPHSKYPSRSFVLIPMNEIGNYIDPRVFLTCKQLNQ